MLIVQILHILLSTSAENTYIIGKVIIRKNCYLWFEIEGGYQNSQISSNNQNINIKINIYKMK